MRPRSPRRRLRPRRPRSRRSRAASRLSRRRLANDSNLNPSKSAVITALFVYPGAEMAVARNVPSLDGERLWWRHGIRLIAGVDEVGRGALAGPLVAAAVILPPEIASSTQLTGVVDSKLLRPEQREHWYGVVCEAASAVGIGIVEADELDEIGVGPANRLAMERAVFDLACEPEAVFLDATVTELPMPQVGLIDGDATCLSIAAASIVAKVTRDRIMTVLGASDDRYGFPLHKGYGTAAHLEALRLHGPCAAHRRCFAPVSACLGAG